MSTKPAREFLSNPLVRSHIEAAGQMVGREAATVFEEDIAQRIQQNADVMLATLAFDSPLELTFWIWWMAFRQFDGLCREDLDLRAHVVVKGSGPGEHYVLDFVVAPGERLRPRLPYCPLIGVELDGHAYHETTLEQVTARNKRDRTLQQAGWRVFHYSFSEFTKEPETCVTEVLEHVRETYLHLLDTEVEPLHLVEKDA